MDLVTVFRSADADAEEQAEEVCELLHEAGIQAQVFSPSQTGAAMGAYEVRVPADRSQEAERLLAAHRVEAETTASEPSHQLDMVTVFRSDAHNAEMLAAAVESLLEANGIPAVIVGAPPFPSLPFEVRVPRSRLEEALGVIRAAEEAGPEAAEEAERSTEGGSL